MIASAWVEKWFNELQQRRAGSRESFLSTNLIWGVALRAEWSLKTEVHER
jgi:hypothetical protein